MERHVKYWLVHFSSAQRLLVILILKYWKNFLPAIEHHDLSHAYFQQDGAPAHYATSVRNWLDQTFPNRCIGRRGQIEWPARSPDLTPPDFFVWGVLKNKVFAHKPRTIDELRQSIIQECSNIQPERCQKVVLSVV